MTTNLARYTITAIVLHWLIAAAIIVNLSLGVWMHEAIDVSESQALAVQGYQLHKSLGMTVLLLSILRLGWRLSHSPPPLRSATTVRQARTARIVHTSFYALMVLVPLSGWLLVSTQWRGDTALNIDTILFDQFKVPHLFNLHHQSEELRQQTAGVLVNAHAILAFSMAFLGLLHVAAALVHQFHYRDRLLARMAFVLGRPFTIAPWLGMLLSVSILVLGLHYGWRTMQLDAVSPQETTAHISAAPGSWQVIPDASSITFAGEHAGNSFTGRFQSWHIDARLHRADMASSTVAVVVVDTASAVTGNSLYDRTLPDTEWLDVETYPHARFEMSRIEHKSGDAYVVIGKLQLKNHAIKVAGLSLDLQPGHAHVTGEILINRELADLGMASDPNGEWVSPVIRVMVDVLLTDKELM